MIKPFELLTAESCSTTRRTPVISRRDYQVCTVEYVVSGSGFLQINQYPETLLNAGDIYFLFKHSDHCYYPDSQNPWSKLFFVVDGALMQSLMASYGLLQTPVIRRAGTLKHFFSKFMALTDRGGDHNTAAALLFHEFAAACAALLQHQQPVQLTLEEKLRAVLEQDLARKFVLNEYARQINMTPEHLIRVFQKKYLVTPQKYRLQQRLDEAARLLAYSELSIKEIAALTGFADAYGFSNSFRKHRGVFPLQYRRNSRN